MPDEMLDEWINAHDAALIMTKKSGHTISPDYVRLLSNTGKIRSRAIDGRTKLYCKMDAENYTVRSKSTTSGSSHGQTRLSARG